MHELGHLIEHSLMITGFVFIMMLVIEYVNVQTNGVWEKHFSKSGFKQYLFAALLGVLPGCLGSFTAVALYSHRIITFGALVTTMIATSGDEAFVMFARIPKEALIITGTIFIIGIIAGYFTDKFVKTTKLDQRFADFHLEIHENEHCDCFNLKKIISQLRPISLQRALLIVLVLIILGGSLMGAVENSEWNWERVTLFVVSWIGLFIVLTVPEHFLEEHLWNHIVRKHIPRIFLWTFGTIAAVHVMMHYVDVNSWISQNIWLVLLIAVAIGMIPESGPHMIFISLFITGAIPLSILIANSIVQDGHGMIPLLAESKRAFLGVKLINMAIGLSFGVIGVLVGF